MKPEVEAAVARLEDRLTLIESRQLEIPEWRAMELPIAHDTRTLITALREAVRRAPDAEPVALTQAAKDVLAERARHTSVEGWTPEHDDEHVNGEMAVAAACYAEYGHGVTIRSVPLRWPWANDWWKPSAVIRRNLEKAGALILAEMERIDRAAINGPAAAMTDKPRVQAWCAHGVRADLKCEQCAAQEGVGSAGGGATLFPEDTP